MKQTYTLTKEGFAVITTDRYHSDAIARVRAMGLTPERTLDLDAAEHWL